MSDISLPSVMTGDTKPSFSIRLRTIIFRVCFPIWTFLCCTYCLPLLLHKSSEKIAYSGHLWAKGTLKLLRMICHVTYDIRGEEHVRNKHESYVFVSNHQSVWETAIFLYIRRHPAYILKQELLRVPLFGLFLKHLEMIAIDRSAGGKALKDMCRDARSCMNEGRDVILFPEGTRVPLDKTLPFQPGAVMLYRMMSEQVKMIPVAHNSGAHWSAHRKAILPGVIVLEYGPPLAAAMNKADVMDVLEKDIKDRSRKLIQSSVDMYEQ